MVAVCILNPAAGRGRSGELWQKARRGLLDIGIWTETLVSAYPGHAAELTQQAITGGAKLIIAAGGDGTVKEVAGVAGGTGVKMAVAPFGTGNDLARGLGIPREERAWVAEFSSFGSRKIDLGRVNGEVFANNTGYGFDARVAHRVNSGIGVLSGRPAYFAAVALCLADLKAADVEITVDGSVIQKRVLLSSFANSIFTGGGLPIAPEAKPDDGLLDLIIIEEVSRFELINSFPLIMNGKHISHPAVSCYRGRVFTLRSGTVQYVHLDGEVRRTDNLDIHVEPRCLEVMAPKNRHRSP